MKKLGAGILFGLLCLARSAAADTTAQSLPFSQDWTNTGMITVNDDWSGVPGITGWLGQNITTGTGVNPQTLTAESTVAADLTVLANLTSPASTAGDVGEFSGANVPSSMIALQGSGNADAPHIIIALDTRGTVNVRVKYDLVDIDTTADDAIQPVALQYRVGDVGAFADVPAAFVADATEGPSLSGHVTSVDAILPPAAGGQPLVQIRIITANAVGNDEWVGIDNIQVLTGSAAPSGSGQALPPNAADNTLVDYRATIVPGQAPASVTLTVTCDLSQVGGDAAQTLYDDATHNDPAAGDLQFNIGLLAVGPAIPAGDYDLPCTVTDDQARSSTFAIPITIAPTCGDGRVETPETCDDGLLVNGDGCDVTCTVESGWTCTGEPSTCTDIDECTLGTDDCGLHEDCINDPGSFHCSCSAGYEWNGSACVDVNECTNFTNDCVGGPAACTNTDGSYTCSCPTGYEGDGHTSGTGCNDIDECTQGTDNCDPNAICTNDVGTFSCACPTGFTGDGTTCTAICGDGLLVPTEGCDDGGSESADGCDDTCQIEPGWTCTPNNNSVCTAICGDGLTVGSEECDDGDTTGGDGCSDLCHVEDGWNCTGSPSTCSPAALCGDGTIDAGEDCDDGNTDNDDGCDAGCTVETGWACTGEPSACIEDADGDGIADDADNCPSDANANQADADGDGLGDACDDDNGSGGGGGCCSTTSGSAPGSLLLGLVTLVAARRRRNRK